MKNVLVQVAPRYLVLTACEQVVAPDQKEKKTGGAEKVPFSFSSPLLVPVEKELLKERDSVWEDPDLLARLVKDGLSQMGHSEVKDVIMVLESFDLTCQEYVHIKGSTKALGALAIEQIKEFVGDNVSDFSVIYKDYTAPKTKNVSEEITAKAFAIPQMLIDDLSKAFKSNLLNLIKVVPAEAGMIYSAQKTIYSFDKTVALISMDFNAVRVVIAKNTVPLYCHDFPSPVDEILKVIEDDRNLATSAAFDYLRTAGYGFQNDCRTTSSKKKLEEIEANIINEIVNDIRLVTMSLNIEIDQIFLSDLVAYIPNITNYFHTFGLSREVMVISDTFRDNMVIPEPSLKARDDFYKNGSFFLFNEIMNNGTVYTDNLIYGLKAAQAKTIDAGKKVATMGCYILAGLIALGMGTFAFFNIRKAIDEGNMNDPKYDSAKVVIAKRENLLNAIANQDTDAKLLPRTQLYCEDVINQINAQVKEKINNLDNYSITHTNESGAESYEIPISGSLRDVNHFIELQNSIKANGYFTMDQAFSANGNPENNGYLFSAHLSANQQSVQRADSEKNDKDKKGE